MRWSLVGLGTVLSLAYGDYLDCTPAWKIIDSGDHANRSTDGRRGCKRFCQNRTSPQASPPLTHTTPLHSKTLRQSCKFTVKMECNNGNAWIRTGCIFTYNGSTLDIILNYSIFIINLIYCTVALQQQQREQRQEQQRIRLALICLWGVVAFQWILCLILECSGISIIWCAMCGWTMHQHKTEEEQRRTNSTNNENSERISNLAEFSVEERLKSVMEWIRRRVQLVILLDVSVIVYYAVVSEVITTVAHLCALILGVSIHIWFAATSSSAGRNNGMVPTMLVAAPLLGGGGISQSNDDM